MWPTEKDILEVVPKLAGGGSFSQRKNLIECAQGHQPVRCPKRVFCADQCSGVPSAGAVLVVAGCVSVVCWWW